MASPVSVSPPDPTARLLGQSAAIQALRAQIRHLAAFDAVGNPHVPTLLLQGETGTGKGLVARVMHDSGPRASGPFVDVNCAAIPDTLLEAELFGYEAGAFSEAKRAKPGLFEAASGGTVFLDEIDALPLVLQGKLLTALEAKRVRRLGAVRDQAVDVKLIAAAQTELSVAVHAGQFRADLYHRLAVVVVTLPPLRSRGEDVLVLARAYIERYAAAHRVHPKRLSPAAEAWLRGHRWPGNVRELSHLLERITLLSVEPIIDAETLAQLSLPPEEPIALTAPTPDIEPDRPLDEAARIRQALQDVGGNVVRAARRLGLSRGGLRYRIQRHGITPPWGAGPSGRAPQATPAAPPHRQDTDTPLLAEAPASAPVWERKPVAVLVIDLVFPTTADSEARPVEPWTAVRRWEQAIEEKVRGFGGILLQRLSSLLIVAFGVPRTLEQLPERALQAALAIRQLVIEAQLRAAREPVPEVRQAVHLGTMLVETRAGALTNRYQAEGDTLSLAVRLLGHVGPGELWVSSQVGRLVAGWCKLQARDAPSGAGHAPPMPAYGVAGLVPRHSPLVGLGVRPLSRFVGRAREMAWLCELLAHVKGGRGQVVGIVGEPGVGKSRLVYEFTRALQTPGRLILASSPVAYGKDTPYLPVIDLLKAYLQLETHDDGPTIRAKVTGTLRTLDEALGPLLPAVLTLLDVPVEDPSWQALDPEQRRQHTLAALKRLWLRESQVQPLLLVIENLHWIDTETQAFLDSLVDSLPTARIFLVVNYRPDYRHGWGSKTYYTQLRLDPLGPESTAALLHDLVGEDAGLELLKQRVIDKTEGNPFFVEESVCTLVETQVLVGERGAYRLAKSIHRVQVPTTVQAVLGARIDRLPPEAKRLLQTAAVIGTDVPLSVLQAIAEVPEEPLRLGLTHLQAAEFLYETRLLPERAYTFKHALTQQVAYESLLQEQRCALHAHIVEAMETLAGDRVVEQVDRLAHHALRGEVWDKAVAYSRQAGERALAQSAYREALGYFEQALGALSHLPEHRNTLEQAIDLRLALRSALRPLGDFGCILAYLHEAEALAAALGDPRRLAQAWRHLSAHFFFMGAYDRAIADGQRALALAQAGGEISLPALANLGLGYAYHAQGDYRRAIDCLGQTVASLEGEQRRERFGQVQLPAVQSRVYLAWCHAELGTFAEGRALGEEGLRIAEAVDHPGSLMWASWGIGLLSLRQGDLPRALPPLERAMGICHEVDLPMYFPHMAEALGAAYTLCGRVADAGPLLTRALERAIAMEIVHIQAPCRLSLGEAQLLAGRLEEAHALAEHTLALARTRQERGIQAYALRLLGEIAAQCKPPEREQAETYYQQALSLAEELGMRPLLAHCHLGLGTLYLKIGQREGARTELTAAIELYRAMEITFWLPEAEATLAQMEG